MDSSYIFVRIFLIRTRKGFNPVIVFRFVLQNSHFRNIRCFRIFLHWKHHYVDILIRSINLAVYCLSSYIFFWLTRSLVDPTLAAFIVCGPLQFLVSHFLRSGVWELLIKWETAKQKSRDSQRK